MIQDLTTGNVKVILLGDAAAGKTKLMQRFLLDGFDPRRLSTHAVNIFHYEVESMYSFISYMPESSE
jgi:GTPase SAR1 family protein